MSHLRQMGFSLLELSVVLGIISLVMVAGVSMSGGALKAADRVTTQERLNTIQRALEVYAKINGHLPCPAQRNLNPGDPTFGREARIGATNTIGSCTVNAPSIIDVGLPAAASAFHSYLGAVPVRNLGLPDSYAGDAWGNKFSYVVGFRQASGISSYTTYEGDIRMVYGDRAPGTNYALSRTPGPNPATTAFSGTVSQGPTGVIRITNSSTTGATGDIARLSLFDTDLGNHFIRKVDAYTVDLLYTRYKTPTSTGTSSGFALNHVAQPGITHSTTRGATYAVISAGPDGKGAYAMFGVGGVAPTIAITCGATTNNDVENCDATTSNTLANISFYDTEYNDNTTNAATFFDDYIVWGSTQVLAGVNGIHENTCPAGTCSPWCAQCTANFPSSNGSSSVYDDSFPPKLQNAGQRICKKIITSATPTSCNAACFWTGTSFGPNAGFTPCP